MVWGRALEHATQHAPSGFDVPVDDGDRTFRELARDAGLTPGDQDGTAWMDAADGFVLVDRTQRRHAPHPMRHRNGDDVARRLAECSLYDPALDLVVETVDGRAVAYSLYWYDPTTKVGLVEPVRVDEEFQRRGLARAMLTTGIARLVARGARQLKVSFESEQARALYAGIGFRPESTTTWYRAPSG